MSFNPNKRPAEVKVLNLMTYFALGFAVYKQSLLHWGYELVESF